MCFVFIIVIIGQDGGEEDEEGEGLRRRGFGFGLAGSEAPFFHGFLASNASSSPALFMASPGGGDFTPS